MKKLDLLLLHVPFVGLCYMFTLMDSKGDVPTYAQAKLPLLIQGVSIIVVVLISVLSAK